MLYIALTQDRGRDPPLAFRYKKESYTEMSFVGCGCMTVCREGGMENVSGSARHKNRKHILYAGFIC